MDKCAATARDRCLAHALRQGQQSNEIVKREAPQRKVSGRLARRVELRLEGKREGERGREQKNGRVILPLTRERESGSSQVARQLTAPRQSRPGFTAGEASCSSRRAGDLAVLPPWSQFGLSIGRRTTCMLFILGSLISRFSICSLEASV